MGVFEQRYSSGLLRGCITLSLLLTHVAPSQIVANEPHAPVVHGAASAPMGPPSPIATETRAHVAVRLPPAFEAFLTAVIGACDIKRPGAVEPMGYRAPDLSARLKAFVSIIDLLPRIYGDVKEYEGPALPNLAAYVGVTEPTRFFTGSLRGDLRMLVEKGGRGEILPARKVTKESSFVNGDVRTDVMIFDYFKQEKVRKLLEEGTTQSSVLPSTLGTVVARTVMGVMVSSGLLSATLRQISTATADPGGTKSVPVLPPESSNSNNGNGNNRNNGKNGGKQDNREGTPAPAPIASVVANGNSLSLSLGPAISLAGVGIAAGYGADAIDRYQDLTRSELGVVEMTQKMRDLPMAAKIQFLTTMEKQLQDVILPEIYRIGVRAAESEELKDVKDGRVRQILEILFTDYPRKLDTETMLNVFLDIWRAEMDVTHYAHIGTLLKHFGPIAQQFLQYVTEMGDNNDIAKAMEGLQDEGKMVPFEAIEAIIKQDKNAYPLVDISHDPIKAGKLFQVHTAKWRHENGEFEDVVVRVLKPGVLENLDLDRHRMKQLSGRLASALSDPARGINFSRRRIEQLIDMFYDNLVVEGQVDRTVENHRRAAALLTRDIEVKRPGRRTQHVKIGVPKAFPALAGSQVMVMERVKGIIPFDEIKNRQPERVGVTADALMTLTVENALVNPMQAAIAGAKAVAGEDDPRRGFMHADQHPGNVLWTADDVKIIDLGLVVDVAPEKVEQLAKLSTGGAYNSRRFIYEALWDLRDPAMEEWEPEAQEQARLKLVELVNAKTTELNQKGEYWSPDRWVEYVWAREVLDFPSWLVLMRQGFRAISSTHEKFTGDENRRNRLMTSYTEKYRDVFANYLWSRTKGGWGPIIRQETWARVHSCKNFLLGQRKPKSLPVEDSD